MTELRTSVHEQIGSVNIQLELETSARIVSIEGPSGAGKSTLLRILAGTLRPKHAMIQFRSETWQDKQRFVEPWRRSIAWVPQDALLLPHLNVLSNLAYAKTARQLDVSLMASQLDIAPILDRWPRHLSGGERQRVALGRALLARQHLLLLDEPFSALDRNLRAKAQKVVSQWANEAEATIVLVSHHTPDFEDWTAERWLLEHGRLSKL